MENRVISKRFLRKVICLIVLSLFSAFCLTVLFWEDYRNLLKEFVHSTGEVEECSVDFFETFGYEVTGNTYITLHSDPQLVIEDIDLVVDGITVDFSEPLSQSMHVQIYYTSDSDEIFSEEKLIYIYVEEGSSFVFVEMDDYLEDVRLDIGSEPNIEFELERVSFHSTSKQELLKDVLSEEGSIHIFWERIKILSFVCAYFFIHVLWGWKKVFNCFFEKRWLVAGIFLLFMVVNRYHGDSFAIYDNWIQPGSGSEYVETIIGEPRSIRSDEWMVTNAKALSSRFLDSVTDKYNPIVRGTDTLNDYRLTWYSIINPISVGRVVINCVAGYEYGYSFYWYARILFTLLMNIEFFMLISDKKRLLSLTAACMVVFSSFYMWWNFPDLLYSMPGFLFCFYSFFICERKREKIFYALGAGILGANFIIYLYPAWMVPMVYMMLAFMIWAVVKNWDRIRQMKKGDYLLIVSAIALCAIFTVGYMLGKSEYMEAITNTVYPGSRVSTGGFCLYKIFDYIPATLFAFNNIGNPCEHGVIATLFPIPIVLAIYILFVKKKKDGLLIGNLIVSSGLLIYVTVGIPEFLAKLTLMSYSPEERALDILAYCQLILLVRSLSLLEQENKLPVISAVLIAILVSIVSISCAYEYTGNYMEVGFVVWAEAILAMIIIVLIGNVDKKYYQMGLIVIMSISIVSTATVRPVSKGLDAIDSKPVAYAIKGILDDEEDTKWIAYGGDLQAADTSVLQLSAFSIACGAPTINSTNTYPNMELWTKLDPKGRYLDIYNRYAHVNINFTEEETSFELLQADVIQINLFYGDIDLTEADYIFSLVALESNEYVTFECSYAENGAYIYKIIN